MEGDLGRGSESPRIRRLLVVVSAGLLWFTGCGGQADRAELAMSVVTSAARTIYDNRDAKDTGLLIDDIDQIFDALGVPVFGISTDAPAITAARARGEIFAIDTTVQVVAAAMARGTLVGLDSFVDDLAALGVTTADAVPLTRASFRAALEPLAGKITIGRNELLLSLVLALGQERARRGAGITDAVWGDARLDPLQFTLLYYALRRPDLAITGQALRLESSSPPEITAGDAQFALSNGGLGLGHGVQAVGLAVVLDAAGKLFRWPVTPTPVSQAVCAPIYLFCHRLSVTLDPEGIYLRQIDGPGHPYVSHGVATLTFHCVPVEGVIRDGIREVAGCGELPPPGPVAGKQITWDLDDSLTPLGNVTEKTEVTAADGTARLTYEAKLERVPEVFRVPSHEKLTVGTISVEAHGVVPGLLDLDVYENPETLHAYPALAVHHYELPPLFAHVDIKTTKAELFGDDLSVTTWKSVIPLQAVEDPGSEQPLRATGSAPFSYQQRYSSSNDCNRFVSFNAIPGKGNFEAGIAPAGLAETMPLYLNIGTVSEVWQVGGRPNPRSPCEVTSVPLEGSASSGFWLAMHEDDWRLGPFHLGPSLFGLSLSSAQWTSPSEGVLRLVYARASTTIPGLSEETTVDLSMSP
jgi:hypothetical protein